MDTPELPVEAQNPETHAMTLPARLGNIYVAPGEVFESVKASPPMHTNWVVPLIISIITSILFVLGTFSQPAIYQKVMDQRNRQFDKMAEKGMSQQQIEQAKAATEKLMTPMFLSTVGSASAAIGSIIMLLLVALIAWGVGRLVLHGTFTYLRAMEVTGLSLMISALGAVITMLLNRVKGDLLATPSPAFFLSQIEATNKVHLSLSALNVMSFWWIAVLALGIAKLSGASWLKASIWLFGIWAVLTFGPIWLIPR